MTLLLAQVLFGFSFSTYFLLPKYLQTELGAGPSTIGWISGAAWTTSVLCVPITGSFVDRLGRRTFQLVGSICMVFGCSLFALADTVGPLLVLGRLLQGVGFSLYFVAASTTAADLAPPERLSQAIGWFGATMVVTNALAPAIAEPLALSIGWENIFWGTAIFAGLAGISVLAIDFPPPHETKVDSPFTEVLKKKKLHPIWFVSALAGLLFGAGITFSAPWALDSGLERVSVFFISYACASAFVRFAMGGMADKYGHLKVAIMAMALYGIAPLLLVDISLFGLIIPGVALGAAQGLYYPAFNALAVAWSDAKVRGTVMALYNGSFNVGFTLGSVGMGPVVELIGYPSMFVGTSGAAILALLLMAKMASDRKHEKNFSSNSPDPKSLE